MDLFSDPNAPLESAKIHESAMVAIREDRGEQWGIKWRPQTLDEMVLPAHIRTMVQTIINEGKYPNLCFHSGKPGTGKTTLATLIPKLLNTDFMFIKVAGESQTIIEQIEDYAMMKCADNRPRFVVMDEADHPKVQDPAKFYNDLQPCIEASSQTLRFILTCNNIYRLPEPMWSRCTPISFSYNTDDVDVKKQVFRLLKRVTAAEVKNGTVDVETLKQVAKFYYPDIRNMLNSLMVNYLQNGGNIQGSPTLLAAGGMDRIWEFVMAGDDTNLRKYIAENVTDYTTLFVPFMNYGMEKLEQKHRWDFSVVVGEHQFRSATPAVDQEINVFTMCVRAMRIIHGR
jgi:replication-associated recombination protein RarA